MARIRPFQALRPREDVASKVAALPYDVYNREEALEEVKKEPLSFLKVDRAETQFPEDFNPYDPQVYQKAKDILQAMTEEGILIREEKPCYYIYELTMNGRAQTGLVGCAAIDDYLNDVIKKHELTREDKEQDRINHVDVCNAQTGPIFLAYRSQARINEVTERVKKEKPLYDFTAVDGVKHIVWIISEERDIEIIATSFAGIESIYIADGHHRTASAVKVGLKRRAENPAYTGEEEFNFFLSVLFPHDQLMILDYNRVVKDLNGLTKAEFLERLSKPFLLEELGDTPYKPNVKGNFGLYLEGTWYKLTAREEIRSADPVEALDVSFLQNHLLKPILQIIDIRTDKRIDFVGGIRGLKELEKRANSDMKCAFSLYPTSIQELFTISDAGLLMPPKSTWFEPKLRSGLFIHELE
ncbi:hypothetical protein Desdi_3315 [Desulfitobacterium dichloroeliminans LMG P-21439]|uniref:DUF1015 domain-containing protein n=1 Tax=Desulfitobacterium dichloroeliminans (strain LMG P-21439 / DCA1) TaxID=871963 RepID=L0FA69_DESDL|nr:DUF1015 family protein [Desulfitobacterium dichloroeliminans]AGA70709.1 hypothetical protein Desdi_3315 [Desulfitobacterium dichloroeliminans LMG P-21439]